MKTIAIEGALRKELGSKSAKQLRKQKQVPCVIYGGEETIHFSTDERSFQTLLFTPEMYNVEISLDGKKYNAVIRDVQYHPVTDDVEHVDFFELIEGKEITIQVPVVLRGNAKGVRNGGRLKVNLRKLRVKAEPSGLPGHIDIDIENLRIGEAIRVQDVPTEGFVIDHEDTRTICLIQTARNAIIDDEDEEGEDEEGEEGTEEGGSEGEATEASAEA